jgi:sulfopyruvate decarboxylase TPP-binding subunit
MTWSDIFLKALKDNDVRLVAYVPDNVLKPLISAVHADNYFMPIVATREDEATRRASISCSTAASRKAVRS